MQQPTKASPEQQALYKKVVTLALQYLFDPKQAKATEEMAKASDPGEAVASVTAMTLQQMKIAAQQAGGELSDSLVYSAAKELILHLVDMLVSFKTIPDQQGVQVVKEALQKFLEITGKGQEQQSEQSPMQPTIQQPQQAGGLLAQGV